VVTQVIEEAVWAPSAGNLQPWRLVIVTDEALRGFLSRFEADAIDLVLPGAKEALLEAATRSGRHIAPAALNRMVSDAAPRHELSKAPPSHLLIVYYDRPGFAARLRTLRLSASLTWFRLRQKARLKSKARYLWLVLSHWRHQIAAPRRVRLASVCNFVYALTLCAYDRGVDSCIIAAFNPRARAIRRFVGLQSHHEIVAVVALGHRDSVDRTAHPDHTRWKVDTRWLSHMGRS